jgi:hypothetical protein
MAHAQVEEAKYGPVVALDELLRGRLISTAPSLDELAIGPHVPQSMRTRAVTIASAGGRAGRTLAQGVKRRTQMSHSVPGEDS